MAMSATLGVLNDQSGVYSAQAIRPVQIVGDSSYPAGGYTASATQFGFTQQIVGIIPQAKSAALNGYYCIYDPVGNTVRFFIWVAPGSTATEVASAANLASVKVNCFAVGW